jgi:hypothetical protein
VLTETIDEPAQPVRLRGHTRTLGEFADVYKQINAPFGQLGRDSLKTSTAALASGDASNDATYIALTNKFLNWTDAQDAIVSEIKVILDGVAPDAEQIRGENKKLDASKRWFC